MKKLIKVLVYLNVEDAKMPSLVADINSELLALYELYKTYGVGGIKVTTTGFQADKDPAWGLETPVKEKK